jgi:hypothetical protein
LNPSRGARQTRLWRAAFGGEFVFKSNLIQFNPSCDARRTRLRRAAIGEEIVLDLI